MNEYGLERVISPKQVFPASAWELDNSRELKYGEMRISLRRVHVENTSFRQIFQEASNDEEVVMEKIRDIITKRGKLHNPVTDTGGLFYGVIEEIGPGYRNDKDLKVGDEVICNTSLSGVPLYLDNITSIDKSYPQFEAEGYAIILPGTPVIKKPDDLPMDLLLFTFNESGTIYKVAREARGKKRFAVIANNMLLALLYGYTIRKVAGEDAEIFCIFDRNTENMMQGQNLSDIVDRIFQSVTYQNLMRPVDCLRHFKAVDSVDMVVNCADIPGAETVSVMAAKSGGTVVFANFIANYHIALYITESASRDIHIQCAEGYLEKYDEFDFDIVRELAPYVENSLVSRDKIRRKGSRSSTEKAIFDHYNHYDISVAEGMIAVSRKMHTVLDQIMNVSRYDCNVLITGATGVGKEKAANIIQKNSARKMQPFVKINCASISPNLMESEFFGYEKGAFTGADNKGKKGYFEVADNGIIFLDEVGELPLDIQAKLLRVIQEGEFMRVGGTKPIKTNVRIIAATNRDLMERVAAKAFRSDLYYRLNVVPVVIPPLDERKEDIPPLIENFINIYNNKFGVNKYMDEDAKDYMVTCEWPGNIRELENVTQRLMISSQADAITLMDVMREVGGNAMDIADFDIKQEKIDRGELDMTSMVESFEKSIISYACQKYKSTRKAAKAIGISQTQLVRKKAKYEIE